MEALARKSAVAGDILAAIAANNTTQLASTAPGALNPDGAAAVGTGTKYARDDHNHEIGAATAVALTETTTSTEGSSTDFARADHLHSTAALPWGLLANPTTLTSNSSDTSGTTELDLGLDQTITTTAGRRVKLSFSYHALVGGVADDLFEIRFKESGTQVAAFRGQIQPVTGTIEGKTVSHIYTPTAGSRTFEVFMVRTSGTGVCHVLASATAPATFTVEDVA